MKSHFLLIFALFIASQTTAQVVFQKTFGGTAMDEATSVNQTLDGGFIMAGTTTSYGSGGRDILVIKTNVLGDTSWTKTFGGETDNEYGYCVQQTTDGGYIVSGVASSFADVAGDMYLIKLTANGDTTWTRTYGGIGLEWGAFVQETNDNGFIIVGQTPAFGSGSYDAYLVKITSTGEISWTKTYGNVDSESAYAVSQTSDGGYILTGENTGPAGGSDIYLVKTDASGNLEWTKSYGRTGSEKGIAVSQTTDGGYIIGGTSENDLGPLGPNMCLVKTNALGDTLWAKLYGGALIDECYDVAQTLDGGYILCGKSFSFSTLGDYDVYVVKVNSLGIVEWSKTYGGDASSSHNEIGNSIDPTYDGGYVIAGESLFGFGVGMKNLYLVKIDSLGISGCNEGTANTVTKNFLPQVITPTTLVSTGGNVGYPLTRVNSGTTPAPLCSTASDNSDNIQLAETISIAPNPFTETVVVQLDEQIQVQSIHVYDLSGQLVFRTNYPENAAASTSFELDLSALNAGLFLVQINTENFSRMVKVVKGEK